MDRDLLNSFGDALAGGSGDYGGMLMNPHVFNAASQYLEQNGIFEMLSSRQFPIPGIVGGGDAGRQSTSR